MKWRKIPIGTLVTLFVIVIAGIIVYYATKKPEVPKREKLVFTIGEPIEIGLSGSYFGKVELGNIGNLAAEQVTLTILVKKPSKISPRLVSTSTGSIKNISVAQKDDTNVVINIPVLAPRELVTANLAIEAVGRLDIMVYAKSKRTIAENVPLIIFGVEND